MTLGHSCWAGLGFSNFARGPDSTGGSGQRFLPKLSMVWRSPEEQEPLEAAKSTALQLMCVAECHQPLCHPLSPPPGIYVKGSTALRCCIMSDTTLVSEGSMPVPLQQNPSAATGSTCGANTAPAVWQPRALLQLPTTLRCCHRSLKTWHSYRNKWALKGNPDLLCLPLISWLSSWRSGPSFWHLMNKMPTLQEMG